jgi:citrate synthase
MSAAPASDFVTAAEAAALLGVKPHTIYTYVSRGFIRSVTQPARKARLYYREDVERARARGEARLGQGPAAEGAMRWGQPVVDTTITDITPHGPRYRGALAVDLVRARRRFERVADLLWTGVPTDADVPWPVIAPPQPFAALVRPLAQLAPERQIRRVLAAVAEALALSYAGAPEQKIGLPLAAARQLLQALAGAFGYLRPDGQFIVARDGERIAALLARALGIDASPEALAALDAALIVSADHEFAPSTFAARIAASTGADVHACVVSALCAFEGTQTGLGCDKTEDLLADARTAAELRRRFAALQAAGQRPPGFNHPLYPRGDPRAAVLIDVAHALGARAALPQAIAAFLDEAGARFNAYPSLPVGLVCVTAALRLPRRAAGALMALGRCAGWVAHVQEQRLAGFLMRPRARYVGAPA